MLLLVQEHDSLSILQKLIGQNLKVLTPSRIDDLYYFSNNLSVYSK